ncbi:MAG TPA: hypothetical protein VFY59_09835 [Rubrobacter sp.]|nr:hypothetical protein [Rubrobacter sp.]
MNIALIVIFAFLALALFLGIRARRGQDMDLEQWTVGGRGFGTLFVFLLLAGEIYTTFRFLGGSGWAYGEGGPAFYILSYGCLAYVMSYWLLPAIWRYATEHRLHSQSDFFVKKYDSKGLGLFVSLVAVVAMVPYLALQLQGLGIIVSVASYGTISPLVAATIGTVAVTTYVMISGIRGSAWTAVIKDALVLVVVVFMGLYLPLTLCGGIGDMFREIQAQKPGFLALPAEGYSIIGTLARVLVPVVALVSLWFSQQSGQGVVLLLLLGHHNRRPLPFPAPDAGRHQHRYSGPVRKLRRAGCRKLRHRGLRPEARAECLRSVPWPTSA